MNRPLSRREAEARRMEANVDAHIGAHSMPVPWSWGDLVRGSGEGWTDCNVDACSTAVVVFTPRYQDT